MLPIIGVLAVVVAFLFWLVIIRGLSLIRDSQVGIVTRVMGGKPLPEGSIIAVNGEVGVQAYTLRPGLYYRFPLFWRVRKGKVTVVPDDKVGVVTSGRRGTVGSQSSSLSQRYVGTFGYTHTGSQSFEQRRLGTIGRGYAGRKIGSIWAAGNG